MIAGHPVGVAIALDQLRERNVILAVIEAGQVEAGTMEFYMQANSHPLAYEALKDMMHAAAGIESDAEKVRFGAELGRFMMAGRNMPTNTYTLYETAGGVTTRVTPNSPEGGWITVRVLP